MTYVDEYVVAIGKCRHYRVPVLVTLKMVASLSHDQTARLIERVLQRDAGVVTYAFRIFLCKKLK